MPDEQDPPRKFYELGKAKFERANPDEGTPGAAAPDQDVHAIPKENPARANAAGLNELTPQERRPSLRKRDFWLLFSLGNIFFGGAFLRFGLARIPGLFGLGG